MQYNITPQKDPTENLGEHEKKIQVVIKKAAEAAIPGSRGAK